MEQILEEREQVQNTNEIVEEKVVAKCDFGVLPLTSMSIRID